MKTLYLGALGSILCFGSIAQTKVDIPLHLAQKTAIQNNVAGTGLELMIPVDKKKKVKPQAPWMKASYTEWVVGETYYDLQTNSSVMARIAKTGDQRSTIFTLSNEPSGYSDRGTGYNFTDDEFWDEYPLERIESIRTGWPSVLHTGSGKEIVLSHEYPIQIVMNRRNTIGSGAWSEEILDNDIPEGVSWHRATMGGSDNNTLHLIALTMPSGNQTIGTPFTTEGLDGAILYSRSQDEGDTWDIYNTIIPGMDSTQYIGFSADSYAIDAEGDKVALAVFNSFADSFVMISEDNGDTWTKTILRETPVDLYDPATATEIIDIDGDLQADTIFSSDNSGAVFIDNNGLCHVTWGNMNYLDDVLGDDQWSYFPFTDGLSYWNENMGADAYSEVAFVQDFDGSGELELAEDIGAYFMSMTSMSQIAQDADGSIYISYSGVVESHATGTQNYRHLFVLKSLDDGDTWSEPVDFTPDEEYIGFESIFPSMAADVDDYVHILYQRDDEPGLAVRGDLDPAGVNELMYMRISNDLDPTEIVSMDEIDGELNLTVYPNPAQNQILIEGLSLGDFVQIYNLEGRLVLEARCNGLQKLDVSSLNNGLYLLRTKDGKSSSFAILR